MCRPLFILLVPLIGSGAVLGQEPANAKGKLAGIRFLGAGSCASMGCHNGQSAIGALGSEYTTWAGTHHNGLPQDPHSQAYQSLFNPLSVAITRNMGSKKPAHENALCLNCHVIPDYDLHLKSQTLTPRFAADGVSCESCHGPAEQYLADHYRPAWKFKSATEKVRLGWRDTRSLNSRARGCAACHVGSASTGDGIGQDVNHDLYAAGHPPLRFEFGSYHASLTHHWQDARDKDPRRGGRVDFEAAAWIAGQLATTAATLDLLTQRAKPDRPWPEFAEYDCYACHQSLKPVSARTPQEVQRAWPWQSWSTTMLKPALKAVGGPDDEVVLDLRKLMEAREHNRDLVRDKVLQAKQHLSPWVNRSPGPVATNVLFKDLFTRKQPALSWEEATQRYVALAAIEHTRNDGAPFDSIRLAPKSVSELRKSVSLSNPGDFQRDRFNDLWLQLGRDALASQPLRVSP